MTSTCPRAMMPPTAFGRSCRPRVAGTVLGYLRDTGVPACDRLYRRPILLRLLPAWARVKRRLAIRPDSTRRGRPRRRGLAQQRTAGSREGSTSASATVGGRCRRGLSRPGRPAQCAGFAADVARLIALLPGKGTVMLIEKCSGAVGFEAVATEHRWVVHISGGSVGRGDLTPDREAVGHLGSPFGRAEQMPSRPEVCGAGFADRHGAARAWSAATPGGRNCICIWRGCWGSAPRPASSNYPCPSASSPQPRHRPRG